MTMISRRTGFALAALSGFLFIGAPVFAATVSYTADLKGSTEVPPNDTKGTGTVTATFDTSSKKFSWTITYSGLTGPATAAHFHAPAVAGTNAPPVIPIPATGLASPIKGDATLTDSQVADLEGGKWYFNVHTSAHPGGEIRGQMAKK
jgi:hypothetical protein